MLINQQVAVIVMERKGKQQNHQPASSNSEGKQKTHYSRNRQCMLPSNKKISYIVLQTEPVVLKNGN